MAVLGTRAFLQPVIYVGLAVLLHGVLLVIPVGWMTSEADLQTTRGMRVRVVVDAPRASALVPPPASPPPVASGKKLSRPEESGPGGGGNIDAGAVAEPGSSGGTREGSGSPGEPPRQSDFDRYLSRLRSEGVQGWAKDSTESASRGWKGSGAGTGGWGSGTGSGTGTGSAGGEGNVRGGGGKGGGTGYLDPRVRMVVTSYPPTGIERRYTAVPYPELKLKRRQYASGWWNVYIMLRTDSEGKVLDSIVLRPETEGTLEKMFVAQVRREISRWTFDPVAAEIHVDVRFYVE